jgi:hypothetical protein
MREWKLSYDDAAQSEGDVVSRKFAEQISSSALFKEGFIEPFDNTPPLKKGDLSLVSWQLLSKLF